MDGPKQITIVLIDDQAIVRAAFRSLLNSVDRFEVIGDPVVSDRPDMSPPRASVGTAALPPGLVGAVGSGRGVEGDGGRQCI